MCEPSFRPAKIPGRDNGLRGACEEEGIMQGRKLLPHERKFSDIVSFQSLPDMLLYQFIKHTHPISIDIGRRGLHEGIDY